VLNNYLGSFYKRLIAARSINKDKARKEFILNILLLGSIVLTFFGFLVNVVDSTVYATNYNGLNPFISFFVLVLFSFLLFLSRNGKSEISSRIMVGLLFLSAVAASYRWGSDTSEALLIYALVIIIAGALTNSKISFFLTFAGISFVLLFSYLEINHILMPDRRWKTAPLHLGDSVVYSVTLGLMWVLAWLSNREIEKSLKRARASEAELKKERDLLEVKVEERTRQLNQSQIEKVTQLYRFAEIGRLSSSLVHDLMTPLSLISLNLELLKNKREKENIDTMQSLVKRAIKGTKYLETSVGVFRKQLQNQEFKRTFSLQKEINEVMKMLHHKATVINVKLMLEATPEIKIYGNQIKFSQLITNLLLNAIDAYEGLAYDGTIREVRIRLYKNRNSVMITVRDQGVGILSEDTKKVFQPFFTTKSAEKGTGIGLSISKDIVENSFKGKITVLSSKKTGTIFTMVLPLLKKEDKKNENSTLIAGNR